MITYRFAEENDIPVILSLVRALASYEHMEDAVVATPELYHEWLFEKKIARVLLALDGENAVGFALFFYNFSTWLGRAGIYLEDLFVLEEYRGQGIAEKLVDHAMASLDKEGISKAALVTFKSNDIGNGFWEHIGFTEREDLVYRNKNIRELERIDT